MSASPSSPPPWPPPDPDADEQAFDAFASHQDPIDLAAARWAARQRDGLDERGRAELRAWLATDPRHPIALDEMAGLFAAVARVSEKDVAVLRTGLPPRSTPATTPLADRPGSRYRLVPRDRLVPSSSGGQLPPRRRPAPFALAAMVALAVVTIGWAAWTGWAFWRQLPLFEQSYATGRGQQLSITLADGNGAGSRVHLDTASQVVVRLYRNRREVDLRNGQAQFQVASDPDRPFHVQAGSVRITVVGTRFSVRHTESGLAAGQTVISVEEGKVSVRSADAVAPPPGHHRTGASVGEGTVDRSLVLIAGQRTVADAAGDLGPVASLPPAAMAAWRDGRISFDQTRLGDAIAEFERYGRTGLAVSDPAVAALLVGGSYSPGQARRFAETLPRMLPVRLERRGELTEIVAK